VEVPHEECRWDDYLPYLSPEPGRWINHSMHGRNDVKPTVTFPDTLLLCDRCQIILVYRDTCVNNLPKVVT